MKHNMCSPSLLPAISSTRAWWGVAMLFQSCPWTLGICRMTYSRRWCLRCEIELEPLSCRLSLLNIHEQYSPINSWYLLNRCFISCVLSGWEPFIEPWPCSVSWQQQAASRLHPPRLKLEAKAKRRLDINITSVLIGEWEAACCRLTSFLYHESLACRQGCQVGKWLALCLTTLPHHGWTPVLLVAKQELKLLREHKWSW